jgi:hypothetical protein
VHVHVRLGRAPRQTPAVVGVAPQQLLGVLGFVDGVAAQFIWNKFLNFYITQLINKKINLNIFIILFVEKNEKKINLRFKFVCVYFCAHK